MSRKIEFVERATEPGAKVAPLSREFGLSRQTGYKWLKRFKELGYAGLEEHSRRPNSSPLAFGEELVAAVLETRDAHPNWERRRSEPALNQWTPSKEAILALESPLNAEEESKEKALPRRALGRVGTDCDRHECAPSRR